MAWEILTNDGIYTYLANLDLSGHQYRFMAINATRKLILPAAGARCVGVLQNKPGSGIAGTVAFKGQSKVIAGAAITLSATGPTPVTTDNAGRAVLAAAGNAILGYALLAASGAGIVITVQLVQDGLVPA